MYFGIDGAELRSNSMRTVQCTKSGDRCELELRVRSSYG